MALPMDERLLLQRAVDLLPPDDRGFKANSPVLLMGIAAGPDGRRLAAGQIEDNGFATELRRESLYGPTPIFDRAKGTSAKVLKGALIVAQPNGAEIKLDPEANIAFKIPLPLARPRQDRPSAIYEEDVELPLAHMMRFAKYMFDRVDVGQSITDIAIAVKMFGTDRIFWCKKTEAGADLATLSACAVVPPPDHDVVFPTPAVRLRSALADEADKMAEGFIASLKSQARWE